MMRSTIAVLGTFITVLFVSLPASAQMVCGTRTEIVNKLSDSYEEQQTSAGIARNGNLVEVFSSREGSWTIIYTIPGGQTCLMAVGENWQALKEPMTVTGHSY
jgi:hypothetical protein